MVKNRPPSCIFDGTGLSYVFVEIDPAWRIPWDRHPDARAAPRDRGAGGGRYSRRTRPRRVATLIASVRLVTPNFSNR
jgi:hypothetical protein